MRGAALGRAATPITSGNPPPARAAGFSLSVILEVAIAPRPDLCYVHLNEYVHPDERIRN
jgi:hypothetical protein